MRSKRFKRRAYQKRVVNGVRVDAAYLRELAQKEQDEAQRRFDAERLAQKRAAVRRRKRPTPPKPPEIVEPVPEVVEEEEEAEVTGDVEEDE